MSLLFLDKVSENQQEFGEKVKDIARGLRIHPDWLMALMWSESKLNPYARNLAGSSAVGLIQWTSSTANTIGTTTAQLLNMSNVEQLDWVERYLLYAMSITKVSKIKDYDDLYLLVFYPAAIGKGDAWVFPSNVYRQNAGMDINKDGQLSIADFKAFIRNKIPAEYLKDFTTPNKDKKRIFIMVSITLVLGMFTYLFFLSKRTK